MGAPSKKPKASLSSKAPQTKPKEQIEEKKEPPSDEIHQSVPHSDSKQPIQSLDSKENVNHQASANVETSKPLTNVAVKGNFDASFLIYFFCLRIRTSFFWYLILSFLVCKSHYSLGISEKRNRKQSFVRSLSRTEFYSKGIGMFFIFIS